MEGTARYQGRRRGDVDVLSVDDFERFVCVCGCRLDSRAFEMADPTLKRQLEVRL